MKKILCMLLVGLSLCARAQIRDTLIISQSDVAIDFDGQYHHVYYGDEYIIDDGAPELPIVTRQYYIPYNATDLQLTVSILDEKVLENDFNIKPSQGNIAVGTSNSDSICSESEGEASNYPKVSARITSIDCLLGHQIASVTFYPFLYDSESKTIQKRDIAVSLGFSVGTIVENDTVQSSYREYLCKEYAKSIVRNPELLNSKNAIDSDNMRNLRAVPIRLFAEGRPIPDFIIITNEALKESFKPLAEWKTRRGIYTIIETIENISNSYSGYDLCEQIRNYLIEKEMQWGNGLFVLLGGGIEIVPSRYYDGHDGLEVSDLYYVDRSTSLKHTTENNYNSINVNSMIGRFPVDNACEANILVGKVIDYEKASNNIDYSYIDNTLVANGYLKMSVDTIKTTLYVGAMRTFYDYVRNTPKNHWFQYDMFNRHSPDTINGVVYSFSDTITGLSLGEDLTRQNFLSALADGRGNLGNFHLVIHSDHCGSYNMGTSSTLKGEYIYSEDIDNLQFAEKYYQVIFSMGCHPADFSKQCIGKSFLMKPESGAVAFMSNTDIGWASESRFVDNFYKKMYGANKWDWESSLGPTWLNVIKSSTGKKCKFHLLGDPTMCFWTDTPEEQDIQMSMNGSTFFLTVTRSDELVGRGSTICVYKKDEVYLIDTLCSRKEMTFYLRDVKTSGYVYVTSTGLGLKPHIDSIYFDTGDLGIMDVVDIELSDQVSGNGDGVFSAGEIVDVRVTYESNFSTTYNVPVTLSTEDTHVEIISNSQNIGVLGEDGYTTFADFSFRILPDSPDLTASGENNILFNLNYSANGETFCIEHFYVDTQNPMWELKFVNSQPYLNGEEGLYYIYTEFIRTDTMMQFQYDFNLYSLSETPLEVLDTVIIEGYGRGMSAQFFVKLNDEVDYSDVLFEVEAINEYGHATRFPIKPFSAPPSFTANNSITLYPESDYIDIYWKASENCGYNIYSSTDGNQFFQLNELPIYGSHFKHNLLSPLTTYYYQIEPVLWGVRGERSDTCSASTTCVVSDGFPKTIIGSVSFRGQFNSWDVDLDGQHEIFGGYWNWISNNNGIVAVRPDGTGLYEDFESDIIEPIATTSGYYMNGVAVGELYDDAVQYVVSSTYSDESNLANNVICYSLPDVRSDNEEAPSIHWKKTGTSYYSPRSPIMADLDGDDNNEIIVPSAKGNVKVFDSDGSEIMTINAAIRYKNMAVAKIKPGDDKNYLIVPNGKTLGVYNCNGSLITNYSVKLSGYVSTPVICDYDNDGYKEAVFAELTCFNKNDVDTIDVYSVKYRDNDVVLTKLFSNTAVLNGRSDVSIAVGDLNNDSYIEIVMLTSRHLRIYDSHNPSHQVNIATQNTEDLYLHDVPIISDVNGDGCADVIYQKTWEIFDGGYADRAKLKAVDYNGRDIPGFSLPIYKTINDALMAADIDGDGMTEIACGTTSGHLYVWKTKGSANDIEWGYSRGNVRNTGEYGQIVYPDMAYGGIYSSPTLSRDLYVMGNSVTIEETLDFEPSRKIVVWENGVLNIDGATLNNARIVVKPGGKVNITDGATINLRDAKSLVIPKGAQLKISKGVIK